LGRLQPLVDSKWIENIELHGCDVVHIELKDGTMCDGPAVADSDEELIADLQFWASRSKEHPRPFSPATPEMNLPLGESARLAAFAWVTLRPMVTIRLHGMVDVDFDDLIAKGTLTPLAANFLGAVVRAGESIVVSGAQGAGKTTLCRALCAALPPSERIITFETDRELHLERMPNKHPRVFGIEARQGQGEFRPDGREAGKFEISEALIGSLRHNADRLLVGEVRGGEIMAMIQAMQGGRGSISTTHARSARDTYNKLVTCCLEVPGVSESYATRTIASAINYVAFIKKVNIAGKGERVRRVRRVTEIIAIELTADGVSFTDVFKDDGTGVGKANTVPPYVEDLVDAGFDYDGFVRERGLS
jgi:pilus assembly protein CpaF